MCGLICNGQIQRPNGTPGTAEAVAAASWKRITTTCSVVSQGRKETMTFLFYPKEMRDSGTGNFGLVEYSGAWTKLISMEVTAADKLNGIQFHGMAVLGGEARRHIYDGLYDWSAWKQVQRQDIPGSVHQYLYGTGQTREFVLFVLEEQNNQWLFKVPLSSGGVAMRLSNPINMDSFATNKKSCAELTLPNPIPKPLAVDGPDPQTTKALTPFVEITPELFAAFAAGGEPAAAAQLTEKTRLLEKTSVFLRVGSSFNVLRMKRDDPSSVPIVINNCCFVIKTESGQTGVIPRNL
jgi:hypothetical protein